MIANAEQVAAAVELGKQMYQTDEWLRNELRDAKVALENGGLEGLKLIVRDLSTDDHFKLNWWPRIEEMAGGDEDLAHEILWHVWDGYTKALALALDPTFTEGKNALSFNRLLFP